MVPCFSFQGLCSAFDIIIQCRVDFLYVFGFRPDVQSVSLRAGLDNNSNQKSSQSKSSFHSAHSTPSRSPVHKQQVSHSTASTFTFFRPRCKAVLLNPIVVVSYRSTAIVSTTMTSPPPASTLMAAPFILRLRWSQLAVVVDRNPPPSIQA